MWNHGSGPSVWLEDGRHWRVSMPLMSTMTVLNATAWGMAKANATIQIQAIIIWKWIQWLIILVLWVTGFLDNFWHWDANEPMGGGQIGKIWFAWRAKEWPWVKTFLFRSSQQLPRLSLRPLKGVLSWHGALPGPSTHLLRQRSSILSYRYRKSDIFREKYRIGIVSVSKFMNWKVSYQYQYRLFKVESISIGISITFFKNEYQI